MATHSSKRNVPYNEGTWFGVPLQQGGYAVGRVGRRAPGGRIILAFFFGPKRESLPSLDEVELLEPHEAIKILRLGDLGLFNGSWPTIGDSPRWEREKWPIPAFIRRDDLSKSAWRVIYAVDDPNTVASEQRIHYETAELESAGLYGSKAVEAVLSHLLAE